MDKITYIPGRNFCHSKGLIGAVFSISENLRYIVQGPGHCITKCGQKNQMNQIGTFMNKKDLLGQCLVFLKM